MAVFKPDSFAGDWYGFLSNQISHIGLGVALAWGTALVVFAGFDEMPIKTAGWWLLLVGYVTYELLFQKWQGWDTVEDTLFVVVYGGGGAYAAFSEIVPGDPGLIFDIHAPLPFAAVAVLHLLLGVAVRKVIFHDGP